MSGKDVCDTENNRENSLGVRLWMSNKALCKTENKWECDETENKWETL